MLNERDAAFFRAKWLRMALTVAIAAWFAYEVLVSRDGLWMVLTGAALAYSVWNFFIKFPDPPKPDK